MLPILIVLSRWVHVATACVAVGGVFFSRVVLPIGLRAIDADKARPVLLKCRRVFKMVIHTSILLLLLSGAYNFYVNLGPYHASRPLSHGLIGTHTLLGLVVFAISLWLMAPKEPRPSSMGWTTVTLGLMLLLIAVASLTKYVREHPQSAAITTGP